MNSTDETNQPRTVRVRKRGEWMGLGMVFGMLFGTLWGNIALGLSFGIIVGSLLEGNRERKARAGR